MKHHVSTVYFILISLLLIVAVPVNAQRLCEAIVENALEEAGENCQGLDGDKACYGYDALSPTFYADVEANALEFAGSSVDLLPLHVLKGTAFDDEEDEWGVGYVQIGDGGSDHFEDGEFIRLILLGDVMLENSITPDTEDSIPFEEMYMTAGDDSDCQEAVNDLVIQTPKDIAIDLWINDVLVGVGSTVVFGWGEDNGNEVMYVTVLDGGAFTGLDTDEEQFIGLREVTTITYTDDEEPVLDAQGNPVLDANGNPMTRRFIEGDFSEPEALTADGEGFRNLSYYETFELIPESLLNYPIDLEAEEEPCECENEDADSNNNADTTDANPQECSVETGEVTSVTFTNNSDSPIEVYWNNFECVAELFGVLEAGQTEEIDTVPGHEWSFWQGGTQVSYFVISGARTYSYP